MVRWSRDFLGKPEKFGGLKELVEEVGLGLEAGRFGTGVQRSKRSSAGSGTGNWG